MLEGGLADARLVLKQMCLRPCFSLYREEVRVGLFVSSFIFFFVRICLLVSLGLVCRSVLRSFVIGLKF